jgi:hypothetical protein
MHWCSYVRNFDFTYKVLLKVLKDPDCAHITIRKSKGAAKCDECAQLKTDIHDAKTIENKERLVAQLQLHVDQAEVHRQFLWKHNTKAQ